MKIKIIQNFIDVLRGKNKFDFSLYVKAYKQYKFLKSNQSDAKDKKYKIIFKFDDLIDYGFEVKQLDKIVKKENLKVCWGIIGKSLEKPSKCYINFIKENNQKKYHFFNHGFYHLGGPAYEFLDKPQEKQENYIKKTQKIVLDKTGIELNSFGAPCNKIDNNTLHALENVNEIKYWFYGLKGFSGINIERVIDMEIEVGKPEFDFFKKNWESVDKTKEFYTLQGHPYMWGILGFLNFKCIVEYLKQQGVEFILPENIESLRE